MIEKIIEQKKIIEPKKAIPLSLDLPDLDLEIDAEGNILDKTSQMEQQSEYESFQQQSLKIIEDFKKQDYDSFLNFQSTQYTGDQTELIKELEYFAQKQYDDITSFFVGKDKNFKKKYSFEDHLKVAFSIFEGKKKHKETTEAINSRCLEECIQQKMNEIFITCNYVKIEHEKTTKVYQKNLDDLLNLKIQCLSCAEQSEAFNSQLEEGKKLYSKLSDQLNKTLQEKNTSEAKKLQRDILKLDYSINLLEKERNECAIKTLAFYRKIGFVNMQYTKSKVFKDVLNKKWILLEQLQQHLNQSVREFRECGNLQDIVDYSKLQQELQNTKKILDESIEKSYPLLKKIEQSFNTLSEAEKNAYSPGIGAEKHKLDDDAYIKAINARDEVIKMKL